MSQSLARRVREVLDLWHLAGEVRAEHLATLMERGVCFYEQPLREGPPLLLFRLFSSAARREEVFLGSVLLHDFLSKSLIQCVKDQRGEEQPDRIELITQDLESAYYVYQGRRTIAEIARNFQQVVIESLPRLYFGDEDPAWGIHGTIKRMFTFTKSDFEPFPVYALPAFLARELEQAVRKQLEQLLSEADFARHRRTIGAAFAFFYGWPSNGRGTSDTQSFSTFLLRLATDYRIILTSQLAHTLGLGAEVLTKEAVKEALDTGQYIEVELRELLQEALARIHDEVTQGNDQWLLGFIRKDHKLIELLPQPFFEALVAGTRLGPLVFAPDTTTQATSQTRMHCRLCMRATATVREQHITFGVNAFRFHNHRIKARDQESTLCVQCAVSAYLQQRVLGSKQKRAKNPTDKRPQIPQRYMMIFHHGQHGEKDTQVLAAKIDTILTLLTSFKQREDNEKSFFSLEGIREELTRRVQSHTTSRPENEEMLLDLLADERLVPGLDMCFSMAPDVQAQVVALGMGANRLLVFILPQIEAGYEEATEFAQRRFSESRLAVFTFLALLQKLCGCHGPYYFESVPRLGAANEGADDFYVHGKVEPSSPLLIHYSAVMNFARRITKYRKGHSLLADWILLAERIEADPFGMLSEILRRIPLRGEDSRPEMRDKFAYSPLVRGQRVGPTGMVDATPYLAFAQQFKDVFHDHRSITQQRKEQEMKAPPLNTALLDEFFTILCRALDRLGVDLLPFYLGEKSTSYEKYPRLLLEAIGWYGNVETGFKDWASKILRDANPYQRDGAFPALLAVEHWLIAHRDLLEGQTRALTYLKRCLLFQTYQYLAPRRQLVMAYAEAMRGNAEALKKEAIPTLFSKVVAREIQAMTSVYGDGEHLESIIADAQEFLITYAHRLQWKPKGTTAAPPP